MDKLKPQVNVRHLVVMTIEKKEQILPLRIRPVLNDSLKMLVDVVFKQFIFM